LAAFSELPLPDKSKQAKDVPAITVVEEPLAFATAIRRAADTDVVQVAQTKFVNGKAPAANVTADLTDRVQGGPVMSRDAEDRDPIDIRGTDEPDGAGGSGWGSRFFGHRRITRTVL
jgi:hypothetical protein